ncbi:MAG TPA: toll/interleukin-1 receptor domain-containing protein [Luteimonas sp.]|nr:toll/interleukin-1 receptor domain-containing protein [Luteimonas sp.]
MGDVARYWAFLSYSHADRRIAERLHRALENYRIPRRLVGRHGPQGTIPARLSPIFRDRDELTASGRIGAAVEAALADSRALIVLCSQASAQSPWVDAEIAAFERNHPERQILCVLLDGEPAASRVAEAATRECLPPVLRRRFGIGAGVADTAPIAVDLRQQGDGWRLGVQKLVAGLAGLPLDQLVQRDAHRRHLRMAWLSAALAVIALTLGAMAMFAYRARDEARTQRAQAEGLIEFMLVDLRKKLEPVGRLDVLDAVGLRALRYYDSQDLRTLDADALGRRARALHLVGEISDNRGDLTGAGKAFDQAAASTGELLRRAPNDPQRLYEHAQSVFWLAMLERERGKLAIAERGLREYAALVARQVALEPGKPEWRKESGYADSNVGTLLLDQGRAQEAITLFDASMRKAQAIVADDPAVDNQLDFAQGLSWLSSGHAAAGQLAVASRDRQSEIALYRQLLRNDVNNHQIEERLLFALRFLAELHLGVGDIGAADRDLDEAATLSARLLAIEPDNAGWIKAAAHVSLDRVETALGRHDPAASREFARARAQIAALLARDPKNFIWRRDLQAPALLLAGRLAGSSADADTAQVAALRELDALHAQAPHDRRVSSLLAQALLLVGDGFDRGGNAAGAAQAWRRGLGLLPAFPAPLEPDSRCMRVGLLTRIGNAAGASRDFASLQHADYRDPGCLTIAESSSHPLPAFVQPTTARRSQ